MDGKLIVEKILTAFYLAVYCGFWNIFMTYISKIKS